MFRGEVRGKENPKTITQNHEAGPMNKGIHNRNEMLIRDWIYGKGAMVKKIPPEACLKSRFRLQKV